MALSPIFVEMRANISEFKAKMGEAGAEIEHLSNKGAGGFSKLGAAGKGALLGFAGAAIGLGGIAVKAALEGEGAHARLAVAIKNAGGSMEEIEPKVSKLSDRMAHLGFTNDQVELALGTMTTATGSADKAMGMMGDAADLARYKHISLADAGGLLARAQGGSTRAFKELGITLQAGVPHSVALGRAMTELHSKIKDQAAAAADTFSGKLGVAQTETSNLAEKVGNRLVPVIEKLVGGISTAVGWTGRHKTALEVVGGAVLALTALTTAYGLVLEVQAAGSLASYLTATKLGGFLTKAWAASQWLLNAALDANPIGLVVIGIAALVAGLVLAYRHSQTFRDIVQGAFRGIGEAFSSVWNDVLKPTFRFLVDTFLGMASSIVHGAASAFGWLPGIGGDLKNAAKHFDKFRDDVNRSLSGIQKNVGVNVYTHFTPGAVNHVNGLASGTNYAAGGLTLVGEEGPEMVNLPRGAKVTTARQTAGALAGTGAGGDVHIHVAGNVLDGRSLADMVYQGLLIKKREQGLLGIA